MSKCKLVNSNCKWCGKTYQAQLYLLKKNKRRYCSNKCTGAAKRKTPLLLKCHNCERNFSPHRRKLHQQFCSVLCQLQFTGPKRGEKISQAYHNKAENDKNKIAAKISKSKQKRILKDPEYAAKLKASGLAVGHRKQNKSQIEKRKATISARYTKEELSQKAAIRIFPYSAWNKGLTKETDDRVAKQATQLIGHPPNKGSGYGKCGFRNDIQLYVRSRWEANIVRMLLLEQIPFEYEKQRFLLKNGKENMGYTPDFYIPSRGKYIEVSGFMHDKKTNKLQLFATQITTKIANIAVLEYYSLMKHYVGRLEELEMGKGEHTKIFKHPKSQTILQFLNGEESLWETSNITDV